MPRTTVDIDATVLAELKRRAAHEGKSLGRVVSEIAARELAAAAERPGEEPLRWESQPMGARVDLGDKEAVRAAMDG